MSDQPLEVPLPAHSSPPQLIAFLTCKDVILERGPLLYISPFRISDQVEIAIPTSEPGQGVIMQNLTPYLFIGVSCYGCAEPHLHKIELKVFDPNGTQVIERDIGSTNQFMGSARSLFTSIELSMPPAHEGRYRFEIRIDEVLLGVTYFTVRRVAEIESLVPQI